MSDGLYTFCIVAWLALGAFLYARCARTQSVFALPLTMFFVLTLNHFPGALVCWCSWYEPDYLWMQPDHLELTRVGFVCSTLCLTGVAAGAWLIQQFQSSPAVESEFSAEDHATSDSDASGPPPPEPQPADQDEPDPQPPDADDQVDGELAFFFRIGFAALVLEFLGAGGWVDSMTALLSAGRNLLLASMIVIIVRAHEQGHLTQLVRQFAVVAGLVLGIFLGQGFLGYGVLYVTVVASPILVRMRHRLDLALPGLALAVYIGLSFYCAYMKDRKELRKQIWGGASFIQRIEAASDTLLSVTPFNPYDNEHLRLVDVRLNQNWLVGASVAHLEKNPHFANGETLAMAVLNFIPRVIWPSKPIRAGSMDLVTQYTGIPFAAGTSVGLGLVFEGYINFGWAGVLLFGLALGALVGWLDGVAAAAYHRDAWTTTVFAGLAGLALLPSLTGMIVETSGVLAATLVIMLGIMLLHKKA
jgi:hypothetical protein